MEFSPRRLEVQSLKVYYWTLRGAVQAVDDVSFSVNKAERFGLVGESGCGKSTTAMAILRLLEPPASIEGGRVLLDGDDLLKLGEEKMRRVRWKKIALIMQGAMNSLNPTMKIKDQIADAIRAHNEGLSLRGDLKLRIEQLLDDVNLPSRVSNMYPHQLSGGMKQRACIAMATALDPELIIADEPTSALDVVVQRAVMQTLLEVQKRLGSSLILIGHDMGLQAQIVDRLAIMYAGMIAEVSDVHALYEDPLHPYTQLLIASLPSPREKTGTKEITGLPPALLNPPPGCRFHPRCPQVIDICSREVPSLQEIKKGHFAACHLYDKR
jgi:peptide/nickel transport system ATP-binding protein